MASGTLDDLKSLFQDLDAVESQSRQILYSVGVMAYNEEANIKRTLQAILEQKMDSTCVAEVIVVASGCIDNTVAIVQEMMQEDARIQLIIQERREGKASASCIAWT